MRTEQTFASSFLLLAITGFDSGVHSFSLRRPPTTRTPAAAASCGTCRPTCNGASIAVEGQFEVHQTPLLSVLHSSTSASDNNSGSAASPQQQQQQPLCDLQTLLRLAQLVQTGGSAKNIIQSGECLLNGQMETRRAKKLFAGDVVTFRGEEHDVETIVKETDYVYKVKEKKVKPKAREWIHKETGEPVKEFGGRYRTREWRTERLERKRDGYGTDEWKEEQRRKKMVERKGRRKTQAEELREFLNRMEDESGKKKRLLRKSRAFKNLAVAEEKERQKREEERDD